MTESTKIFEFSIAHVKPKYLIQCLQEIPVGKKLWEKYGGKYHGTWLTEAGASCQIFALLEWGKTKLSVI